MKHNYTDTQLQAAIDGACNEVAQSAIGFLNTLDLDPQSEVWAEETPARLQLIESALDALPEPVDEESMLLNLLAVIHRDGGHYQAEHGTRKAVQDACKEWQRLILIAEKTGLTEPKQSLSQLRPLAEAGAVPEGCVRYYAASADYAPSLNQWSEDTHFADIRLPESAAKPKPETFEAHGKTWTKHTPGDAMPCAREAIIQCLFADGNVWYADAPAQQFRWSKLDSIADIIGWRYADKPLVTKPISLPLAEDMSLRDWFAGQALAGIVQAAVTASLHNSAQTPDDEVTARWALGLADAMLAAREVKP